MILYTDDTVSFDEGEFYTVQQLIGLPPLPPGKLPVSPGYNVLATAGAPVLTGSVSFQYLENNILLAKAEEADLAIYFWSETTEQWQTLDTLVDVYFNTAVAYSQGPGVYALLAGTTVPTVLSVLPSAAINDITHTLTISGGYYLPPVQVSLVGPTTTYTLPLKTVTPVSITAIVSRGLAAREYQVVAYNLNQPGGPAASPKRGSFALFSPDQACFYDFFESGASQWQLGGDWGIVVLPSGERAMTDSPLGPYRNAGDYGNGLISQTTTITSKPFSLAGCSNPELTFRHDYALARVGTSRDLGLVEISKDNGQTWTKLANYTGGSIFGVGSSDTSSPEWATANWKTVKVNLPYTGTVRLRFSLTVDKEASARGWIVDNLRVTAGTVISDQKQIFLPAVLK
jgi:hypothetical protein